MQVAGCQCHGAVEHGLAPGAVGGVGEALEREFEHGRLVERFRRVGVHGQRAPQQFALGVEVALPALAQRFGKVGVEAPLRGVAGVRAGIAGGA